MYSVYSRPFNSITPAIHLSINPCIHIYIYIHISISYYSDGSCDTVREYTLKATNLCLDLTKYGSSEGASEFRTCIAIGNEDIIYVYAPVSLSSSLDYSNQRPYHDTASSPPHLPFHLYLQRAPSHPSPTTTAPSARTIRLLRRRRTTATCAIVTTIQAMD